LRIGERWRSLRGPRSGANSQFSILNSQFGFAIAWLIVIASRFPALSQSLLDWDETLFSFGVRAYDVTLHHPHPPGYPLFIAAAKLLRPLVSSDFRAVQAVATIGSALLFPVAYFLARELKLRTSAALAAALLTSFLPTIWYYGGTGLSDVPALCVTLLASALLLRGGRDSRAYVAGCIVAAVAMGFRPQLLLIAAVPAIAGALQLRRARVIALSWLTAACLVFVTYLVAAYCSSEFPRGFIEHLRAESRHVHDVDSIANPVRPPLAELAPRALWFPFAGGRVRWVMLVLSAIAILDALVRRRAAALLLMMMFAPSAIVNWLFLDPACTPRYAVAYAPVYAFLAAAGMCAIAAWLGRFGAPFIAFVAMAMTALLIRWTVPALRIVHDTASPPVAVFDWVRGHVPRAGRHVFIENELEMHAMYLMADYDYKLVFEPHDLRAEDLRPGNVLVVEGEAKERGARVFRRRDPDRLRYLVRPRYFTTSVIPLESLTWFLDGWYGWESDANGNRWRWMGRTAGILLSSLPRPGELRMSFYVPVDTTPRPPLVTVTWNGSVIDRIRATKPDLDLHYVLPSRVGLPNEFMVSVDVWPNPKRDGTGQDSRDLGLKLQSMSWRSASAPLQ
jgi:hypothetical protein